MTPLTLVPHRRRGPVALVHLVSSVTAPLGGDDLTLTVRVGPGARLHLRGVAAALALPGHRPGSSRTTLHIEADDDAVVSCLPEPTVATARANHEAVLSAELADTATLHAREVLVLGRTGERPGRLATTVRVRRAGRLLLHQRVVIGDDRIHHSPAGQRVLGTEMRLENSVAPAVSDEWWSVMPLAGGGSLTTVLAYGFKGLPTLSRQLVCWTTRW